MKHLDKPEPPFSPRCSRQGLKKSRTLLSGSPRSLVQRSPLCRDKKLAFVTRTKRTPPLNELAFTHTPVQQALCVCLHPLDPVVIAVSTGSQAQL